MFDSAEKREACGADRDAAIERFSEIRRESEALAANLTPEDQSIQSMPDVSPTKWHLAHTTWFFETFILTKLDPRYRVFDPAFVYLFNSYYEAVGPRHPRPERGLLSRPAVDVVGAYRDHVSTAMTRFIEEAPAEAWRLAAPLVELGVQHEQQHQELILMDIKHVFSVNPLLPAYQAPRPQIRGSATPLSWVEFAGGLVEIGHRGSAFAFDNETPRHKVWLEPFRLARRPVSCGEFLGFIEAGGYESAGVLVFRRLGGGSTAGLGSAALLAPRRWRVVDLYARRPLPVEPGRARLPRQFLRGRCVCQMGWETLAE